MSLIILKQHLFNDTINFDMETNLLKISLSQDVFVLQCQVKMWDFRKLLYALILQTFSMLSITVESSPLIIGTFGYYEEFTLDLITYYYNIQDQSDARDGGEKMSRTSFSKKSKMIIQNGTFVFLRPSPYKSNNSLWVC